MWTCIMTCINMNVVEQNLGAGVFEFEFVYSLLSMHAVLQCCLK